MGRIRNFVEDKWYALGAALTVAMMDAGPALADEAAAGAGGKGLAGLAKNFGSQLDSAKTIIVGGSFVGGVALVAGGLMKLKAAVDSGGQQTKYGDGLWRLGLGAGLVALPSVVGISTQTVGVDGNSSLTLPGFN